jgi:hypothetical protein
MDKQPSLHLNRVALVRGAKIVPREKIPSTEEIPNAKELSDRTFEYFY